MLEHVAEVYCVNTIICFLGKPDKISLVSQDAQNDIRHRNRLSEQTVWFLNVTARDENSNHPSSIRI